MLRRSKRKARGDDVEETDAPTIGSGALVVVDEEGSRELISRLVDRAGHLPTAVDSQASAVAALDDALPRVVVTLMEGDRGLQVVDALRTDERPERADLPVLVLSDDRDLERKAWEAGADGFMARPFHADEFDEDLSEILGRPPEERAAHRAERLEALDD